MDTRDRYNKIKYDKNKLTLDCSAGGRGGGGEKMELEASILSYRGNRVKKTGIKNR